MTSRLDDFHPDPVRDIAAVHRIDGTLSALRRQEMALEHRRHALAHLMTQHIGAEVAILTDPYLSRPRPEPQVNYASTIWVGVRLRPSDSGSCNGAVIDHVYPRSPASRAGLLVNDLLLAIAPQDPASRGDHCRSVCASEWFPVCDSASFTLALTSARASPGDYLSLLVRRPISAPRVLLRGHYCPPCEGVRATEESLYGGGVGPTGS